MSLTKKKKNNLSPDRKEKCDEKNNNFELHTQKYYFLILLLIPVIRSYNILQNHQHIQLILTHFLYKSKTPWNKCPKGQFQLLFFQLHPISSCLTLIQSVCYIALPQAETGAFCESGFNHVSKYILQFLTAKTNIFLLLRYTGDRSRSTHGVNVFLDETQESVLSTSFSLFPSSFPSLCGGNSALQDYGAQGKCQSLKLDYILRLKRLVMWLDGNPSHRQVTRLKGEVTE